MTSTRTVTTLTITTANSKLSQIGPTSTLSHSHGMRLSPSIFISIGLLALTSSASASAGDRLSEFRNCVDNCVATVCNSRSPPRLPIYLTAFFWDCTQNCDYQCQRSITSQRIDDDKPVLQFHGKWPFQRLLGIQEPASVLFSMINFVPHYLAFHDLRKSLPPDDARANFFLRKYYLLVTITGMNAWVWSSVFHCRDFVLTERLDYFSAGLTILSGFYFAVVRNFRLDRLEMEKARVVFTIVCCLALCSHIFYLSFIKFSYSYNMIANVVIGICQNLLWVYYSICNYFFPTDVYSKQRELWTLWPLWNVILLTFAMSLELFDFPPWMDAIDAHSLWHAATIVPSFWWYKWMTKDAAREALVKQKD
ncbi:Per1-like-domain-containing protein [Lipomyces doorenjongii]|uniref:Per1-like-domain-containing protein n=1 Tax=Lipomyces doorenjongii TaxID=383834 RepID=UPI0034CDD1D4